jgi:hypothetical protein
MSDGTREVELVASGNFIVRAKVVEGTTEFGTAQFEVHAVLPDNAEYRPSVNASCVVLGVTPAVLELPDEARQDFLTSATKAVLMMFMTAWNAQNLNDQGGHWEERLDATVGVA